MVNQKGLIKYIFYGAILFFVLTYFGFNFKNFTESENFMDNADFVKEQKENIAGDLSESSVFSAHYQNFKRFLRQFSDFILNTEFNPNPTFTNPVPN